MIVWHSFICNNISGLTPLPRAPALVQKEFTALPVINKPAQNDDDDDDIMATLMKYEKVSPSNQCEFFLCQSKVLLSILKFSSFIYCYHFNYP